MEPNKQFSLRTKQMSASDAHAAGIDAGLRAYMLKVYNYMALGVGLTGALAFAVSSSPQMLQMIFGSGAHWLFFVAIIGIGMFAVPRIPTMSVAGAQITFWAYAGIFGLALAPIFILYTGESIARVFFITSIAFAGTSLFGYVTKKDLSGMGSFLAIGTWGLLAAILVNIFLQSPALQFVYSVIGVLVFAGLTAYETQSIKSIYRQADGTATAEKKAVLGALQLYGSFVMMFQFLLMLLGNRE